MRLTYLYSELDKTEKLPESTYKAVYLEYLRKELQKLGG
jgi:hypothetical protein